MTPRILQIIARLQQADQMKTEAMNLLLQELAEMKAAEEQPEPEKPTKKGKTDG